MRKPVLAAVAVMLAAGLSCGSAATARADVVEHPKEEGAGGGVINGSPERSHIYEPYQEGTWEIQTKLGVRVPGMTQREFDLSNGVRGSSKGGDASGVDKADDLKGVVRNPSAGKRVKAKGGSITVVHKDFWGTDVYESITVNSVRELSRLAVLTPIAEPARDGTLVVGTTISTHGGPLAGATREDLARLVFRLTGGLYAECSSAGEGGDLTCYFERPRVVPKARVRILNLLPAATAGTAVPFCNGAIVDAGPTRVTRLTVEDLDCEAPDFAAPTRLAVERYFGDPGDADIRIDSDGSLLYEPSARAQGTYTAATVFAETDDGLTSFPFTVYFRNRYVPEAVATATGSLDAVRGVERVVPRSSLVVDPDVDYFGDQNSDSLSFEIVQQATFGGAWFDGAGNLHYRSIDVLPGDREYRDLVTVKVTDSYGLTREFDVAVRITEIPPTCANDSSVTSTAPVRVRLNCWVAAPEGWWPVGGVTFSLDSVPEWGAVSEFDPVAGVLIYTPDPAHPGLMDFAFSARNNGATGSAHHVVEVRPTP